MPYRFVRSSLVSICMGDVACKPDHMCDISIRRMHLQTSLVRTHAGQVRRAEAVEHWERACMHSIMMIELIYLVPFRHRKNDACIVTYTITHSSSEDKVFAHEVEYKERHEITSLKWSRFEQNLVLKIEIKSGARERGNWETIGMWPRNDIQYSICKRILMMPPISMVYN